MIVCPVCHAQVYVGMLFCPECCARVNDDNSTPTIGLSPENAERIVSAAARQSGHQPLKTTDRILLHIIGNEVGIPLFGQPEYILGRAEKGQAVIPDIDLNRFGAHDKGVSRLHCHLRFESEMLFLVDLGSANGSFVNEQRVLPDRPAPLYDGDLIRLGQLKIELTRQAEGE
jgi:pSer/pThr/pTyr-binding forkhead associated (FHA) protein